MSDDWKVGDLAVCIKSGLKTVEGRTYTVCQVIQPGDIVDRARNNHGRCGLRFVGVEHPYRCASDERNFRKIRPDEHEDCEPEFVTLLNHIKRKVEACPPAINAAEKLAVGMVRR